MSQETAILVHVRYRDTDSFISGEPDSDLLQEKVWAQTG